MLLNFEQIEIADKSIGGKAWGLGILAQKGFPIPPGIVLNSEPNETEWLEILSWWKKNQNTPLAIRSSAGAEDSAETSFAGQNRTFLNVKNEAEIRRAVRDCFASIFRESSQAYRKFFAQNSEAQMNVVLQVMVQPKYAGVFFSEDPISRDKNWILEVVNGLGEDLVSGKVTPGQLRKNGKVQALPEGFTTEKGFEVAEVGARVAAALEFSLDMEWAIDKNGKLFVLQARPITTGQLKKAADYLSREFFRLKAEHAATTTWDGQTFAEWSGLPSQFTFSLWRKAFSPHHAFGNALRELGYRSFSDAKWTPNDSLLERVFGRAYVNLERLTELYYGDIPYRVELKPRPHTRFAFDKLGLHSFINFPAAAWNMIHVGWNLSTRRKNYYQRCLEELSLFKHRYVRPLRAAHVAELSDMNLIEELSREAEEFSTQALHWPLVLVILTETTTQNLRQLLKSILGEVEADRKIRDWMGRGLHTVTFEMQAEFSQACAQPEKREEFLARYGHRGPGEMDLSHPRWFELGEAAFQSSGLMRSWKDHSSEVENEIHALASFKREMILEEWQMLKKLLETREAWKMEILKPYAWLRLLVGEIGKRRHVGEKIHRLTIDEILESPVHDVRVEAAGGTSDLNQRLIKVQAKLSERESEERAFRQYSLPDCLSFSVLSKIVSGEVEDQGEQLDGEPLSSGIVFGEVRFVVDPLLEKPDEWPENVILVAVSTDPGWTPLFTRAKGIVVERGGVLSHCAILSREMGIPAVGGILGLERKLKSGDQIWVDGNHGRLVRDTR